MTEVLIVLALILLNGLFALSELAVVSARRPRLKTMAAAGRAGASSALALSAQPGRFLSAVQIGITLIGTINGAYSGETFGEDASGHLQGLGFSPQVADPLGFGIVVAVITYLSVIIGELVPKTLALRNAETIACVVAPIMTAFATAASPLVWLLEASTNLVFRLLGLSQENASKVTDEEIKTLIAEAETAGVLESGEGELISGVMRLADRAVVGIMTPRTDVVWIDVTAPAEVIRERLISTPHSRLPVGEGSADKLVGVVQTRELLSSVLKGEALDIKPFVRRAPMIPETAAALDVLSVLRDAEVPMALIHNEYGDFEGLVTPADILEAIAGVFKSDAEGLEPHAVERDDGSWLLSGAMPVDEMAEKIGITIPENRSYETVAGFVLAGLQHLPKTGEHIDISGWRFEVVDLDARRIDKVLASRLVPLRRRIPT
ncbi:hemolysin family protein [Hyphomicrobium sp.]|uniref:hemolysin family protein n=1 Tax=Hyphomicrobium sp. TaxID=82 RepID=UPI000FC0095A|nr:hemolysin family protein [Hyphomicrobium sp.]RUO98097.1 MAG: HlyC/CorC family transporter [Hyphomicrobium sp.]